MQVKIPSGYTTLTHMPKQENDFKKNPYDILARAFSEEETPMKKEKREKKERDEKIIPFPEKPEWTR